MFTAHDEWWAALPIAQKERIATKAKSKNLPAGTPVTPVTYPACTEWWNSLDNERKTWIHDHCIDRHGYLLPDWQEGMTLSY
ncbi:MAG: hypothetical protein IJS13_08170 [Paludibacteraceae bacterium]|nr:hypothetical protein [Paludibacteraceae bacterium]